MAQAIIRNEDFESGVTFDNVRGLIYKGNGTPTNRVNSSNIGAIYLDQLSGQLWVSTAAGEPGTWRPYFTNVQSNIAIDSIVQEGDLIGITGAGAWSSAGSLNTARASLAGAGSQNAAFAAGGTTSGAPTNSTELFNGSVWSTNGNLPVAKTNITGAGSQNAGLVAAGTTSTSSVNATNATDLFDGSTWSTSGILSVVKSQGSAGGTPNSAFFAGGFTIGSATNVTELFNGSSWSLSGNLSINKRSMGAGGSQNAGLVAGGLTGVANPTNAAELFNGTTWIITGNLSIEKYGFPAIGSQNASLVGSGVTAGGTDTNVSELFNGSSWSLSGNLGTAKNSAAGAGSQSLGIIAGGFATVSVADTQLHTQNIYRKLNFNNIKSALNIGIATSVSNTSLTASVFSGNVSGDIVATNTWFGISRFNNDNNPTFVTSTTATISSISSTVTNQAVLNLSTTLTGGFVKGGLLKISNNDIVPIVGGTNIAPVVRWNNISSSASTSLTVGCVWGQKIIFDPTISIQASSTSLTFNQGPISLTVNYQGRVGDTLYIPYASVSGTNGSSLLYGTYLITNVTVSSSGNLTYVANSINSVLNGINETNIGGVVLYQQLVASPVTLSESDVVLGYRNKMKIPINPVNDDFSNGRI